MDDDLRSLLDALYAEGKAHDADQPDRLLRLRNLEPETATLLALLTRMTGARSVVEIGTSNGYSTIWLADAVADTSGTVVSVELGPTDEARANLERAGLADRVRLERRDGGQFLQNLADDSVDLLFLDSERVEYPNWWPHPARVVRPGGVLAVDNVLSHPDEAAPFLALLAGDGRFVTATIPVGKGLHLAWRRQ
ncbi:O-methyltransferase [Planosporangium mesophilum]|uniref:Caffeoyl-CoA O-methyltransferase n=1 Tax=Planosporangium mesophilum TaxID=689768 RepID=A0A8J3TJ35_9ACTN|nr:O-methyltransferase [Planosporangium mesophilum]NJC86482.1 O-methyltransferase [Planosporangium mesophilum]GII26097.1 caffeoyl-CoA O-methyltransferase [Planosporangium mesophilum]